MLDIHCSSYFVCHAIVKSAKWNRKYGIPDKYQILKEEGFTPYGYVTWTVHLGVLLTDGLPGSALASVPRSVPRSLRNRG